MAAYDPSGTSGTPGVALLGAMDRQINVAAGVDNSPFTNSNLVTEWDGPPYPSATPDPSGSATSGYSGGPNTSGTSGAPATGASDIYASAGSALSGIDTSVSGDYTPPNTDAYSAAPGSSYITPESTVAYQLEQIMSKDSALMKRSAALGKQQAGALGLQSSTAGVGMVAGALYDRALQIAAPDAATHAAAQLQQQKADVARNQTMVEGVVSAELQKDKANLDAQTIKLKSEFDLVMQSADAQTKESLTKWMETYERDTSLAQIEAQGKLDKMMQDGLISANAVEQGKAAMMQQVLNTQISLENAMRDPEILALGPEAMANMLENLKNIGVASLRMTAGVYGVPSGSLTTYTDMLTFDFGSTPTPTPSTDPFGWGNYSGVPAPPGIPSAQWANASWRQYYVATHPNMIGPSGKPSWF